MLFKNEILTLSLTRNCCNNIKQSFVYDPTCDNTEVTFLPDFQKNRPLLKKIL